MDAFLEFKDKSDEEIVMEAKTGNNKAQDYLISKYENFVKSKSKAYFLIGADKEDIYQIGCLGFIKAIRRFDSNYDVKLSTYAVPYILGEIKKFLRDDGPVKVSRSLKELNTKINELKNEYIKKGVDLNILEIAKILRIPKEEIAMAIESGNSVESIERNLFENNDYNISDTLSSNIDEATLISNKITVRAMIANLTDKEKEIIMLRFYKDKTQTEVSKILGISQVQVSRIEKRILSRMKQQLIS